MMNMNAMKKAELIDMINNQNVTINALKTQNEALVKALVEVKAATKTFVTAMNGIYAGDVVKAVTMTVEKTAEKVEEATDEPKKQAPRKKTNAEIQKAPEEQKPVKTYKEAIAEYKIKKYGSIEVADKVDRMIPNAKKALYEEAKKTGKYIPKDEYKTALYEKAFEMVKEEMKAEAAKARKTRKTR